MPVYCGIDLGTTNCCAYYYYNGKECPLLMPGGQRIFPSAVAFLGDGTTEVGVSAMRARYIADGITVMNWKRLFGRKYDPEYLKKVELSCRAKVVQDGNRYAFSIPTRTDLVSPELVCSILLRWMCDKIVEVTNCADLHLCLTIPAAYNYHQRNAMKTVLQLADINYPVIYVTEPAAASVAYTINRVVSNGNILVYDLGGGTFDASILEVAGNTLKVKNWKGNIDIGGELFDQRIMDYIEQEYQEEYGVRILPSIDDESHSAAFIRAKQHLLQYCSQAKAELSQVEETEVNVAAYLRAVLQGAGDQSDDDECMTYSLTRERFIGLIRDDLEATMKTVSDCLTATNLSASDVARVVLVGGSSLIPEVRRMLSTMFAPEVVSPGINCSEGIAMGGMKYIYEKEMRDLTVVDCVTRSIFLSRIPNRYDLIIASGTPLPADGTFNYHLSENNIGYAQATLFESDADGRGYEKIGLLVVEDDDFIDHSVDITFTFHVGEDKVLETGFYHDGNVLDSKTISIQCSVC